ncbi:MAG TPA: PAS domain-containing protein [Opitutaceae bacterium]
MPVTSRKKVSKRLPSGPGTPDPFPGGGGMGRRIRAFDWSRHPLGDIEQWPRSLRTAVGIVLAAPHPMWLGWGPEFFFFCNDACLLTFGLKLERVLGVAAREVWSEIWGDIGPRVESVVATGAATTDEARLLVLERSGCLEETYHAFSCSPLSDDDGEIRGALAIVTDDTQRVLAGRRMATLRALAADLADETKPEHEVLEAVQMRLAECPRDLPFALIYRFDANHSEARLACAQGVAPGDAIAPAVIPLESPDPVWPVTALVEGRSVVIDDLAARVSGLPLGP